MGSAGRGIIGPPAFDLFRQVLVQFHGRDLESHARVFWSGKASPTVGKGAGTGPITLLMTQRDPGHGRSFKDVDLLAAQLKPLEQQGRVTWRLVSYLGKLPLVQQTA